jgi:hypothetical protein
MLFFQRKYIGYNSFQRIMLLRFSGPWSHSSRCGHWLGSPFLTWLSNMCRACFDFPVQSSGPASVLFETFECHLIILFWGSVLIRTGVYQTTIYDEMIFLFQVFNHWINVSKPGFNDTDGTAHFDRRGSLHRFGVYWLLDPAAGNRYQQQHQLLFFFSLSLFYKFIKTLKIYYEL